MSERGSLAPPPSYRGAPRRRILVVDERVEAAGTLAALLRHMGHEVQVVHDGQAALEAARMNRPQMVLFDLGVPGVDGYRLVERLRRENGFSGLRLVAVTGFCGLEEPVSIDALRSLLSRL